MQEILLKNEISVRDSRHKDTCLCLRGLSRTSRSSSGASDLADSPEERAERPMPHGLPRLSFIAEAEAEVAEVAEVAVGSEPVSWPLPEAPE